MRIYYSCIIIIIINVIILYINNGGSTKGIAVSWDEKVLYRAYRYLCLYCIYLWSQRTADVITVRELERKGVTLRAVCAGSWQGHKWISAWQRPSNQKSSRNQKRVGFTWVIWRVDAWVDRPTGKSGFLFSVIAKLCSIKINTETSVIKNGAILDYYARLRFYKRLK